jgi:hypothetical protein
MLEISEISLENSANRRVAKVSPVPMVDGRWCPVRLQIGVTVGRLRL